MNSALRVGVYENLLMRSDNLMKSKQKKSWSLILNQIDNKRWNWKKKLIKKKILNQLG